MTKNRISPELLEKLKDGVNLLELVGEHVNLRKAGSNYVGLCPFHSERTPSFSVSESKQVYHCHGCRRGGDVFTFLIELHGLSFPEAVSEVAERARIALPKGWDGADEGGDPEAQKRRADAREKLETLYRLNRFVAGFYHQQLAAIPAADRYFRNRGADDELMRGFYVGVAPSGWDGATRFLAQAKAPLPLAVELGLIRPSPKTAPEGGIGYFDLFRNRAMFPILDLRGKVVGFGGRTMPGSNDDGPKYMNSPESVLFHKSRIAFGLYQAQKHIREKDEVILVEGYFDVLALHAAGFKNVVATCGTALTVEHLALFRKFSSRVTVLFDGDRAGIAATESAMELGLTQGAVLYGASMPAGLDPDEILYDQSNGTAKPDGKERMSAVLKDARPLLDARIDEAINDSQKSPEDQAQAIKKIAGWLARFADPVGREVRVTDSVKRLKIERSLLARAAGGAKGQATRGQAGERRARPVSVPAPHATGLREAAEVAPGQNQVLSPSERLVLRALARGGSWQAKVLSVGRNLPPPVTIADLFDYSPARTFLTHLIDEKGNLTHGEGGLTRFLTPDLDFQVRSVITEAATGTQTSDSDEDLQLALHRTSDRLWARFSQHIKAAMHDAEAKKDAQLHDRLMKEYLDVQRKMKEFTKFYD